jgi:hypothetical protein
MSSDFGDFGDSFLDHDNNGWKDLIIASSHVCPVVDTFPEWDIAMRSVRLWITTLGLNGRARSPVT